LLIKDHFNSFFSFKLDLFATFFVAFFLKSQFPNSFDDEFSIVAYTHVDVGLKGVAAFVGPRAYATDLIAEHQWSAGVALADSLAIIATGTHDILRKGASQFFLANIFFHNIHPHGAQGIPRSSMVLATVTPTGNGDYIAGI